MLAILLLMKINTAPRYIHPENKIIEAFILDFSDDLYGKKVNIEIVKKIRDKKNFKDEKEAIDQITKDVLKVKKILR